ncbi:glycosyltransferase family 2 protein [Acetobacteraceae bacterium H6797]|nr:glycosyltransferase family 2 protein [Acetobacteraceae bacterium H6797]
MPPHQPELSVIIPVEREVRHLPGAVASLGVSPRIEIIIVQDIPRSRADAERQSALLREQDARVRLVIGPARGRAAALNAGLASARGEFAAFLDPADRWLAEGIGARLAMLRADPSLGMVFGGWRSAGRVTPGLEECPRFAARHAHRREGFTLGADAMSQVFSEPLIRLSTVIARRDPLRRLGGFAESAGQAAEWDLWLRLARRGNIACQPRPVAELAAPPRICLESLIAERRIARHWRPVVAGQDRAAARRGTARMIAAEARSAAANRRPLRAAALHLGAIAVAALSPVA